jgi:hypothetical protein
MQAGIVVDRSGEFRGLCYDCSGPKPGKKLRFSRIIAIVAVAAGSFAVVVAKVAWQCGTIFSVLPSYLRTTPQFPCERRYQPLFCYDSRLVFSKPMQTHGFRGQKP